jgi:hypothetical protein
MTSLRPVPDAAENAPAGMDMQRDRGAARAADNMIDSLMIPASAAIDRSRAVVDNGSVRAVGGGGETGPNPTDRGKPGSKHHPITDARGLPLAAILTGANAHGWVPDREQERMRDPSRARDDLKARERKARQQLNAFLLRHGRQDDQERSGW